jgi:hypothetical protein
VAASSVRLAFDPLEYKYGLISGVFFRSVASRSSYFEPASVMLLGSNSTTAVLAITASLPA